MGLKLLIFLGLAWAVYGLVQRARAGRRTPTRPSPDRTGGTEDMVRCAHCDMHLPKSEALRSDDRWYCCREHRDADRNEPRK